MIGCLAGSFRSVVTGQANGGDVESAVIDFGTDPGAGGLVAAFTVRRGRQVGARFSGGGCAVVATQALAGNGNVLVK